VAPNKFVAKIASDARKPDGLTVVPADGAAAFLGPLPLSRMWRVGPKARQKLQAAGLRTIGDLARTDSGTLQMLLGSWGPTARELASGVDDRPVTVGTAPKSLGAEETFETDLRTASELRRPLLRQSMRVSDRLIERGLWAGSLSLKIKYADHRVLSRQARLSPPVADTDAIFQIATELLARIPGLEQGVRLTGVSVSSLSTAPAPELFPDADRERRERLASTSRSLREKFGVDSLTRASLLTPRD
jgi:DNA polymerase-4